MDMLLDYIVDILSKRASTIILADGAEQDTKTVSIQQEYRLLCDQMDMEILELLGGIE